MTKKTLIAAAVVAALASPLAAADQSVEKATRYRATTPEAVSPIVAEPMSFELDSLAEIEPFAAFVWSESAEQIDELGKCCYIWAVNAEQVEELGPFMLNQTEQVEELGPYYWNQSAEQVEELGGSCCFGWNQNAAEVEELGSFESNENTEQVEDLGCCYMWNNSAAEIEH